MPSRRSEHLALGAVLLLACVVRVHGLGTWAFDQDELYTLRDAADLGSAHGGPGIIARPIFYVLEHLLLQIAPPSAFVLRLPALVFGIAGVWLTGAIARRFFGAMGAVIAALLVTLSPWHLYASQFARYWTLVYLLAGLAYLALPNAVDTDSPRRYLSALVILLLGSFTHPTFLFPLTGAVLAINLVSADGKLEWRWPTRTAWMYLWGPLALLAAGVGIALAATQHLQAYNNWGSRGPAAMLRTAAGMIEWVNPAVAVAAIGAMWFLWTRPGARGDRRVVAIAALGVLTGVTLLLFAGLRTGVYADYAISMLPLLYLVIAGAVARLGETMAWGGSGFAVAASSVLVAAVLPGLISNLSDGMRFDYRPAYRYVQERGGGRLVLGWPAAEQQHYAPDVPFQSLDGTTVNAYLLDRALIRAHGFWFVGSLHREELVGADQSARDWVNAHCRTVLTTERPRFDYREYRVELWWCGEDISGMASATPNRLGAGVPALARRDSTHAD
ncbi:MAG TPA: glycosyltransferase family 39 protein [Solirubrobacteraceae bacterium]|nr:glycosyltransferase family 39 protein [Solirubrobacteraceae bacterium]